MANLSYYLLLDHIKIHNANAISSPLTYGFPSITGFLGAIHALSRKIKSEKEIYLNGVMIACHQCDVQTYQPHEFADHTFKLSRNPIGKDGNPRSIIEEGKVHLDVSLVVEVICHRKALSSEDIKLEFETQVKHAIQQHRIAGGSVLSVGDVRLYDVFNDIDTLIHRLMPAFVLVNAKQDLLDITTELQQANSAATALDALIETAKIHHKPKKEHEWQHTSVKQGRGWIVPIHLGYQAISPLFPAGKVTHTRDNEHPTQFVECIYGLGKWVFPYHLHDDFEQAFWRYQPATTQDNGAELYLINQDNNDDE